MTKEHLSALLAVAEAKTDSDGWSIPGGERTMTLHAAQSGASLSVSRIEAVRSEGDLVHARNQRGEIFVLALQDLFAGAVEPARASGRQAGFSR